MLKMNRLLLIFFLLTTLSTLHARKDSSTYTIEEFKEIKTDILIGYYQQDGNHSAVTGGEGTEALKAALPAIIINVPFRNKQSITFNMGADAYSSASSDNINENTTSGASSKDVRIHGGIAYSKEFEDKGLILGGNTSFSDEFDYFSMGFGVSALKMFNNENTQIGLSAMAYFDNWALIYPYELRGQGPLLNTDDRNSYSISLSYSQVLTQRVKMALFADIVSQRGLLSTPYHRVYFYDYDGGLTPKVEYLPNSKIKFPIGIRVNYFAADWLITRFYYRYYFDDFGLKSNTFSINLPIKLSDKFTLSPFYRYYDQTASKYFAPKGAHSVYDEFYTSDYDLSRFQSNSLGVEIEFSKIEGLIRYNLFKRKASFESIKVKYTHYNRSDGFVAHLITLGISLKN
jgi:hypothetical protein